MIGPSKPPKLVSEPIHDNCADVNGPVSSGVSSDNNNGVTGETQPSTVPWPSITKFATVHKKNRTFKIGH